MHYLSDITEFINLLHQSRRFHLLIVQGPPGWGKSSITADALRRLGIDFHAVGSYSTPLALFNTLVKNDGATIVLDDTSGLFQHQQAMSILNAATWSSASTIAGRRVTWTSATEMSAASEVIFRGKLIVLTNHLPNTPAASAFKSRALNYTLEVGANSAGALLIEAAQSEVHFPETGLAQQVAAFLGNYAREFGPHRINLRTLEMGYDFASLQPQRWQELLMMALPKGSNSDLVRELESSGLSVEQQMGRFRSATGKSRRSFFYLREQVGLRRYAQAKDTVKVKPAAAANAMKKKVKPVVVPKRPPPKAVPMSEKQRAKGEMQYVRDVD